LPKTNIVISPYHIQGHRLRSLMAVQMATCRRVGNRPPETNLVRYAEQSDNMKTNAVRLLDTLGVRYELREYEVDPAALEAETVARKIGLPPEQVFKTLVARGDRNGVCLAVVAADMELDEKALARLTGDRKMELVPLKEVQPLTGYVRGGVTALACKREYPVFVDETVELFDAISVSAGARGMQIVLKPADYLAAVNGITGDISRSKRVRGPGVPGPY